jgi:protein ImuA
VTRPARQALLQELAERIRELEATPHPSGRAARPSGLPALDAWLPAGALCAGALVELLPTAEGSGAWTLALWLAQRACGAHQTLVVADPHGCFYSPAAAKLGVDLERCIVARPAAPEEVALVLRQALDCPAVGAALGWLDALRPSEGRRLQLAAEAGGGVGLLLRPPAARHAAAAAALRLRVRPVASCAWPRRVRIEVVRVRGGKGGQSLVLEIDDETGDVRVPAGLAAATPGARRPGAAG